ncbi:1,3-beta-glucanosyltransferase, partial [Podochytrium sp. JEL0797]
SSTYGLTTGPSSISYGTGEVYGQNAQDTLSWGDFSVPKMPFLLVTAMDSTTSEQNQGNGDGILGLAFQGGLGAAAAHNTASFFLMSEKAVPNTYFSIWFNQSSVSTDAQPNDPNGGKLILGGADTTLYNGGFTFLPLTAYPLTDPTFANYFWSVSAASIGVAGGPTISAPAPTYGIVDSGTSLLVIDTITLDQVVASLNSVSHGANIAFNSKDGLYELSCAAAVKLPSIVLNLGHGIPFELAPQDYVMQLTSSLCALAIQGMDSQPNVPTQWILGDTFMAKYYSVFDLGNQQVGFALAANGKVAGNGVPLTAAVLAAGGGVGVPVTTVTKSGAVGGRALKMAAFVTLFALTL